MKKTITITFLFVAAIAAAQVGIGVPVPATTLDIKSTATNAATKALEVNNSDNTSITEVRNNGNFIFSGALMPNGDAGEVNEVLVSGGNGTTVWKKVDVPTGTKIITQVYNARRNSMSGNRRSANTEYRLDFPEVYIEALTSIGNWNATLNEFTVAKAGLYHITSGFIAQDVTQSLSTSGILRINTTSYVQSFKGQLAQNSGLYLLNFTGEIIVKLAVGNKIWISAKSDSQWNQDKSYLHIKYSEL